MKNTLITILILSLNLFAYIEVKVEGSPRGGKVAYQSFSVTNGTSDWLLVPYWSDNASVSLNLSSNQAYIEYTLVQITDPAKESTADVYTWSQGYVTNSTVDGLLIPVWALRVVALTNVVEANFMFRIQQ